MSTAVIAFFNNKGGVGKTSLVYHVACMMANLGLRVVAADLDPQGNLSAAFLDDDKLEELWPENQHPNTIFGAIRPLKRGVGDIANPLLEPIRDNLVLIPGDMALSEFEDDLSQVWPKCLDGDERAFRVISAFWRVLQKGAEVHQANVILIDLGPNLGAINRAALIASDYVVIPLGPDLFSLQGLRNLGPTLREWRRGWSERSRKNPDSQLVLPSGAMQPTGYIVMQHSVRRDRPVKSYDKWIARIPETYVRYVLGTTASHVPKIADDPNCFALLKHYRSLMPMAQEARKPMFALKPADGALGAHTYAVRDAYRDFEVLAKKIADRAELQLP
ncbi:MAG: AAA family ATPase [Pirellulales bacterium]